MGTSISGPERPGRHHRGPVVLAVLAVVATLAVVIGATAIITRRQDDSAGPSAPVVPTRTVTSTVTPRPKALSPTTRSPSASDPLARFFSAATRLDEQLQVAEASINAAGPPWTTVTPRIADLVTAAELGPVAHAIPAGLPSDLRTAVILTYSDLSSRRHALSSFAYAGAHEGRTSAGLLRELGNGHPAAARFDRDLAATRALASESAPIAAVPKSSRQTADVLLLVQYVDTANGGCDSRGGTVVTELPPIAWHQEETEPYRDGTIGGIWFTAGLGSHDEWQVSLSAC
ncbi:MAG TPA: hypothetical protein VFI00_05525 [Kribbella sp.]|nr:hypothetical protein [Kribbella sp.]